MRALVDQTGGGRTGQEQSRTTPKALGSTYEYKHTRPQAAWPLPALSVCTFPVISQAWSGIARMEFHSRDATTPLLSSTDAQIVQQKNAGISQVGTVD